jgi:hypothetical protein
VVATFDILGQLLPRENCSETQQSALWFPCLCLRCVHTRACEQFSCSSQSYEGNVREELTCCTKTPKQVHSTAVTSKETLQHLYSGVDEFTVQYSPSCHLNSVNEFHYYFLLLLIWNETKKILLQAPLPCCSLLAWCCTRKCTVNSIGIARTTSEYLTGGGTVICVMVTSNGTVFEVCEVVLCASGTGRKEQWSVLWWLVVEQCSTPVKWFCVPPRQAGRTRRKTNWGRALPVSEIPDTVTRVIDCNCICNCNRTSNNKSNLSELAVWTVIT